MAVERRVFFGLIATGGAVWAFREWAHPERMRPPEFVLIAEFDGAGRRTGARRVPVTVKADAEWKKLLAVDQYWMTRRGDTELAYAGEYWNFHGDGVYRCVCCGTALFDSRMKFESGTGWPSFTEPIAVENVSERQDRSFGMQRTEVRCRRCEAHLGHVFDDGPPPTGRRYCVNSVSIRFNSRHLT